MVGNQNININLIYNYVMAGFSRGQGVPLHRSLHQLGASTNPNKCIAYPRTLYPKEYNLAWAKLYPDLTWTGYSQHGIYLGVKAAQARLNPGILWPGPIYIPRYIMA